MASGCLIFTLSAPLNYILMIKPTFHSNFIGAAISTVGNAITGAFGAKKQHKRQKELMEIQNQYNIDAEDRAYQRQLDFYNIQNEYNDPSKVKQRYEDAGINPAAAFGTAGSYQPSTIPSDSGAGSAVGLPSASNPFANFHIDPKTFAEIELLKAQKEKVEGETNDPETYKALQSAELEQLLETTRGKKIANQIQGLEYLYQQAIYPDKVAQSRIATDKAQADLNKTLEEWQYMIDKRGLLPHEKNLLIQQAWKLQAAAMLDEANVALAKSQTALTDAQREDFINSMKSPEDWERFNEAYIKELEADAHSKDVDSQNAMQRALAERNRLRYYIDNPDKVYNRESRRDALNSWSFGSNAPAAAALGRAVVKVATKL